MGYSVLYICNSYITHIYIYIVFIHYVIVVPVSWSVWVTLKILENLERVLFISVFRLIEPLRKITT